MIAYHLSLLIENKIISYFEVGLSPYIPEQLSKY